MKRCLYHFLPTRLLSRAFAGMTSCSWPWLKNFSIRLYCRIYPIDMSEALIENPTDYPSLDAFFTRRLKEGARPINLESNMVSSPVDGTIMELGCIQNQQCLQVKGIPYQVEDLLGGDSFLAKHYAGGLFANFYLAPHNYHRIHMPVTGELQFMSYIPGPLLPVKPSIINKIPTVLAGNERLVCEFSTQYGPMIIVLVGAFLVGGIEVSWHKGELVNQSHPSATTNWHYTDQHITLKQGEELGCFHMGSSVVMLLNQPNLYWLDSLKAGDPVRFGETIARKDSV